MEYSNFKIASELQTEIQFLKQNLNDFDKGDFRQRVKIVLLTADGEESCATTIYIAGEVCTEIGKAVKDVIRNRIAALEKEFKEL